MNVMKRELSNGGIDEQVFGSTFETRRMFVKTKAKAFRELELAGQQAAREDHQLHISNPLLAVYDWWMAGRIIVKSTANMETALVLLVAATSTILFYLLPVTDGKPFAVNLDFTLISAAVVFPVSFLIQSTFTRREKALLSMVGVKAQCMNIGLSFFVWDWIAPAKPHTAQSNSHTHVQDNQESQENQDTQEKYESEENQESQGDQHETVLESLPELESTLKQEGLIASCSVINDQGNGVTVVDTKQQEQQQQQQGQQQQQHSANHMPAPDIASYDQEVNPEMITSVKRSYDSNPPLAGRASSLDPFFNERALACLCRYLSGLHTILRLPTRNRTWNLHTSRGKRATAKLDVIQEELKRDSLQMYIRMTQLTLELKRAGMPATEVSRIEQFVALMQKDAEHLIAIKNYRTPQSTRAFLRFFVLVLPMFYGAYYADIILSSESHVSFVFGLLLSLVTAWVLAGLVNVQRTLEDPFVHSGTDGIRIGYEINSVKQHLHEMVQSAEENLKGGPHRHHEHHNIDSRPMQRRAASLSSIGSLSDDFTT